ncbi:MAG: hypothetical protein ACRDQE_06720 [Gaiellales bacterium]
MFRRLVPLLAFAILAAAPAGSALATVPLCTADTGSLRYKPEYTASCPGQTITAVELVKTSNSAAIGFTSNGIGTSDLTVDVNGTLASNMQYRLKLTVDDGSGPDLWTQTFRTLTAPAHPGLHVKYITAIPADAVLDMAHRIDRANIVAVPTNGDFIDASTRSLSSSAYAAALKHHQSALVVTDLPVLNSIQLGAALNQFCNNGHGVVLAGQTHWRADAATPWNVTSAIGAEGGPWATHWSLFGYDLITNDRVIGGDLATSSIKQHFLTQGLKTFHVYDYGSGSVELRDYAQAKIVAALKKNTPYFTQWGGQSLIAEDQYKGGRVVDLGYRPWAKDVSNGGFDPADGSPGGSLLARALWWATNRIPPTNTHFTSKPPSTSTRATVIVGMAAKDADKENPSDIGYRYKVDGGSWKQAVGATFVLYHLAKGRHHTIYARAYDDGGNVDPHVAKYTFYVTPGALG